MRTSERRLAILKLLCRRRHDTIRNLADEFNVSESTIRRDIVALSTEAPIYTQTGRYCGGVYVADNYTMDRMYFTEREVEVFHKLLHYMETKEDSFLEPTEFTVLKNMLKVYTKPKIPER